MLLTVNKIGEFVSGVAGTEKYIVRYDKATHGQLLELEDAFDTAPDIAGVRAAIEKAQAIIQNVEMKQEVETYAQFLKLDKGTGKFYLHQNGTTSSICLPKTMAERIVESVEKDLPFIPVIKAWTWFLKNPNFSPSMATRFSDYINSTYVDKDMVTDLIEKGYASDKARELSIFNDVAISKNGSILAYKYGQIKYKMVDTATGEKVDRYDVSYDAESGAAKVALPEFAEDYYLIPPVAGEGYDAFYCGADLGHRIQVGKVHRLPDMSYVSKTNDAMDKGLWLGGYTYVQGYKSPNRLLMNAFVNPMNIGSFYKGHEFSAIKVLEYFVHSTCFAPQKERYNESTYLEHTNAQWETIRTEALTASEAAISKLKGKQAELLAL